MALAGNQGLLDQLVAEHLPEALRFALRLSGCQETAAEIVQEALCRAARGIGSFRGQSQFRTWFYRIVISAFHDHTAAAARQCCSGELTDELADPRGEDPAAAAMTNELRDFIAMRVSALPLRQREVLVLITYEQLRPREVAEVLGISEANVNVNLHHARARLRDELAPYLSEK
jgi:RNA polymerase sigma-70 factor (ECF subfamily)